MRILLAPILALVAIYLGMDDGGHGSVATIVKTNPPLLRLGG